MTEIALLKFVHVLGLVYWLGTDLGVWYASWFAVDRKLAPETRVTVTKILFALDLSPRICMTLMLPTGAHLGWRLGLLPVPGWAIAAVWAVALAWLGLVLFLHFRAASPARPLATRIDFGLRLAIIAGLSTYAAISLSGPSGARADWLAWKLLAFAAMVGCGLMVRMRLRGFGPAFARLAVGTTRPGDEDLIEASIASTRPWVLLIWLLLLASSALGLHVF